MLLSENATNIYGQFETKFALSVISFDFFRLNIYNLIVITIYAGGYPFHGYAKDLLS